LRDGRHRVHDPRVRIRPLIPACILVVGALVMPVHGMAATPAPQVRVDQLGYSVEQPKVAWLLAARKRGAARFQVETRDGSVVLEGRVDRNRGRWSKRYRAVHPIDFSALRTPGEYRIVVRGDPQAISPWFPVADAAELVDGPIADVVTFFASQRDGPDVIAGELGRRSSHLNDATADLYAWPTYRDPDSDTIRGDLVPLGGETDLVGGWFDAGDYLKFTHTTAYADALLWAMQRDLGTAAPDTLIPEARFGLDWLAKAWHPDTSVLDLQVGIGSGDRQGTYLGDHDLWRLPEADDALTGEANRYLANRPAFRANAAGSPVPPNLAGRVAAAFGLAAQVTAGVDRQAAEDLMNLGAQVLDAAKTQDVTEADVVTALPHAFYPESSWRDDLAWGAAELALAGQALGDARADAWLASGAHWATEYLANEAGDDSLNLYDTSALAMADLVRGMREASTPVPEISEEMLLKGMAAQLDRAVARAAKDPFGAGVATDYFDAVPHAFGLIATARLYGLLTGDDRYEAFAAQQRDWVFGANAWGTSMMVGTGSRSPLCPAHVIANLSGRQDGTPPILRGAVVNGPNSADLFADGIDEAFDEANPCPVDGRDPYAAFTGDDTRFVDDVSAWQTVEPALDFSAIAGYALALTR
jgi:hypothetical protein